MKSKISPLAFLLILLQCTLSNFKREELDQIIPNFSTLETTLSQTSHKSLSKMSKMGPTDNPRHREMLHDVKSLLDSFKNNDQATSRGEGLSGVIFPMQGVFNLGVLGVPQPRVMKMIKLRNRQHTDDLKEQDLLMNEISVLNQIKEFENFEFYFSEFFFAIDITELSNHYVKVHQGQLTKEIQGILSTEAPGRLVAIEMEKLNFTLHQYEKGVEMKLMKGLDIINRVKLAINLFHGLALLNADFIHCDVKPSNLMLKILEYGQAIQLTEMGFPVVEEEGGYNFLVKFIDFGISQPISDPTCSGGTPGFIAPEYFYKKSHVKFDVFSLGVILLDMELYNLSRPNFSGILSKIFHAKSDLDFRNNQFKEFMDSSMLVQELMGMLTCESILNDVKNDLKTKEIYHKYLNVDLEFEKILEIDMNVLEYTLIKLVFILLNKHREMENSHSELVQEQLSKEVNILVPQVKQFHKKTQEVSKMMESIKYMAANSANLYLHKQIHEKYFEWIERAVSWDCQERPRSEEVSEKLEIAYAHYLKFSQQNNDFIDEYELTESIRDNVSSSLINSVYDAIPGFEEFQAIRNDMKNSVIDESQIETVLSSFKLLI